MINMAKPTGNRPKPKVAPATTKATPHMNAVRPAAKHTSMPSPKKAANTKSKGGRRY